MVKPEASSIEDLFAQMHTIQEFDHNQNGLHCNQRSNAGREIQDVSFLVVENIVDVVNQSRLLVLVRHMNDVLLLNLDVFMIHDDDHSPWSNDEEYS